MILSPLMPSSSFRIWPKKKCLVFTQRLVKRSKSQFENWKEVDIGWLIGGRGIKLPSFSWVHIQKLTGVRKDSIGSFPWLEHYFGILYILRGEARAAEEKVPFNQKTMERERHFESFDAVQLSNMAQEKAPAMWSIALSSNLNPNLILKRVDLGRLMGAYNNDYWMAGAFCWGIFDSWLA